MKLRYKHLFLIFAGFATVNISHSNPLEIRCRNGAYDLHELSLIYLLKEFFKGRKDIDVLYTKSKAKGLVDALGKSDIAVLQEIRGSYDFKSKYGDVRYLPNVDPKENIRDLLQGLKEKGFTHLGISGTNSFDNHLAFKKHFAIKQSNDLLIDLTDPEQMNRAVEMLTFDAGFKNIQMVKERDDLKVKYFKSCVTVMNKNGEMATVNLHNLNEKDHDKSKEAGGGGFDQGEDRFAKNIGSGSITVTYKGAEGEDVSVKVITEQAVVCADRKIGQIMNAHNTHKASLDATCTVGIGDYNRIIFEKGSNDYELINTAMEEGGMREVAYDGYSWHAMPVSTEGQFSDKKIKTGKLDAMYIDQNCPENTGYRVTTESLTLDPTMQELLDKFYNNTITIPINTRKTSDRLRHFSKLTGTHNVTVKVDKNGRRISAPLDTPVYNQHIMSTLYENFLGSGLYPVNKTASYNEINEQYEIFKGNLKGATMNLERDRPLTDQFLHNNLPLRVGHREQWEKDILMNGGDHKTLIARPSS